MKEPTTTVLLKPRRKLIVRKLQYSEVKPARKEPNIKSWDKSQWLFIVYTV